MREPEPETRNWGLLADELTVVRAELGRIDGKCSTLAGLASAGLAFLLTQIAAAGPAAAVLRPRLGEGAFCQFAAMTAEEIHTLGTDIDEHVVTTPADLHFLAALTVRKQRRLRAAIDLIAVAVVLIAAGLAAGAPHVNTRRPALKVAPSRPGTWEGRDAGAVRRRQPK